MEQRRLDTIVQECRDYAARYDVSLGTALADWEGEDAHGAFGLDDDEADEVAKALGLFEEKPEINVVICTKCNTTADVIMEDQGGYEEVWGANTWVPCMEEVSDCCKADVRRERRVEE